VEQTWRNGVPGVNLFPINDIKEESNFMLSQKARKHGEKNQEGTAGGSVDHRAVGVVH